MQQRDIIQGCSTMSRATRCLMDAGCVQDVSAAQSVLIRGGRRGSRFVRALRLWKERSRQRRELRELANDKDLLKDLGLSGYDVKHEGHKPFWRE